MLANVMAVAIVIGMNTAQADEIKVMASGGVKEAYLELVPSFEKATGHKGTTIWAGTEHIGKRITEGEVVDIVITAGSLIDKLTSAGKLAASTRVDVAKAGIRGAVGDGL